ncbi:MAG: peptide ABC transporter substrate-binding protein [Oscillospiraceae bacterium]|nr:peptide ABC transporter substrate-binding protein [Oscillospiraceae bacterium]
MKVKSINFFKKIVCLSLVFAFLFLSGCSGDSVGELLSYSLSNDPKNLDPQTASDPGAIMIINNIFEGLYRRTLQDTFELGSASKVEVSSDGKTYCYTIKDNVKWKYYTNDNKMEDGKLIDAKLTADDFLFGFQRLMDPKVSTPYSSDYYFIKNAKKVKEGELPLSELGVRVNEEGQFILEVEHKTPLMEELLSSAPAMPCNKDFFYSTKGRYGAKGSMMISNGPFFLSAWFNTDDSKFVRIRANDKYYDANSVVPLGVNLTVRKQSEAYNKYKSHDIDTAIVNNEQFMDGKLYLHSYQQFQNSVVGIGFNQNKEQFANEKIRTALATAVDRDGFSSVLQQDQLIAKAIVPKSVTIGSTNYRAYVGDDACPIYDSKKAKALLDVGLAEIKSKNKKINDLNSMSILVSEKMSAVVEQTLQNWQRDLGVFLKIDAQPEKEYNKKLKSGEYDCAVMTFTSDADNPSSILGKFSNKSSANFTNSNIPNYQKMLDNASVQESLDSMAREYYNIEQEICNKGNFIPIYYQAEYFVYHNLKDIIFDQGSRQFYYMYAANK